MKSVGHCIYLYIHMFLTQVCDALNRAKMQYAIVGGFAVALHGAVRGTVDLDLVISLDEGSFLKTEEVLSRLGLKSKLPVSAKEVFRFRKEYINNRNLIAWSFYDPAKPANQLDIIITHDSKKMRPKVFTIEGVKVRVASVEDLIAMKRSAGRKQDLEDIKALEELAKNAKK